jgi:hypothetical protein
MMVRAIVVMVVVGINADDSGSHDSTSDGSGVDWFSLS